MEFGKHADHEPNAVNGHLVSDKTVDDTYKIHPTGCIRMGDCYYVHHKIVIINNKNSEFVGQDVFIDWFYFGNLKKNDH